MSAVEIIASVERPVQPHLAALFDDLVRLAAQVLDYNSEAGGPGALQLVDDVFVRWIGATDAPRVLVDAVAAHARSFTPGKVNDRAQVNAFGVLLLAVSGLSAAERVASVAEQP